jgi:drug/metabolite transporter (DMT)-like permease
VSDANSASGLTRRAFFLGLALAMTGSVLFSAKAIVIKLAYRYGVDAETLITLRMVLSAPFFVVAYRWSSRGRLPLTSTDHLRLMIIGFFGYYAASYLDFLGLQYVTAGLERLILYLNPTIVLVLSVLFLRRRLTRLDGLALLLAYSGIVFVFWHDVSFEGDGIALGTALVFGSAVTYAIYLVLAGELVRRLGAIRLTSYAMLVSTVAICIQFIAIRPMSSLGQPPPVYWLSLFNAGFCTVLPVFAIMLAVEKIGAGRASLASMIGPISTIVLARIFLDEAISLWQMLGTSLVLAGIGVLSLERPGRGVSGVSVQATGTRATDARTAEIHATEAGATEIHAPEAQVHEAHASEGQTER